MQHLTLEAVARLVDEPPEPEESLHLRECLTCRRELGEMRAQTQELARLADPEPSPFAWAALEARLAEEGLVRGRVAAPREHAWLRAAAAVALLVMGGAGGMAVWSRGGGDGPASGPAPLAPQVAVAPAPEWEPADPATAGPGAPLTAAEAVRTVASMPATQATPAAAGGGAARRVAVADGVPRAEQRRESTAALESAERDYLQALARYAESASAEDADPVTRLATLEGMVRATRYALERAPEDPVINGYHLAAMGQRDAMLRQIARSSEETWY